MTEEEKWYTLECETEENNSIEITRLILNIKRMGFYIENSQTFAREYYTSKHTVFQVPNSEFQLKLVFWRDNMEIYWRKLTKSNLSEFIKMELVISRNLYGDGKENMMEYTWVQINKWQKCDRIISIKKYDNRYYGDELNLNFKFNTALAAAAAAVATSRENNKPTSRTLQELITDFQNLLSNNESSNYDVTIKSVDGEEFKVQTNILATRCKVLKAHFEHNTKETTTSIVETQWEAKVLRDVLSFLYTGSAPGINDEPEKILAAADFYQLEGLKSLCVKTMTYKLTAENAIETLKVALLHSVDTLRDQTLLFIKDGHARLITETESWANVSCEIMKMIYEYITADEKISYNIIEEAYKECKTT